MTHDTALPQRLLKLLKGGNAHTDFESTFRSTDLFASIPHGEGQTILREALVAADHNAYHFGEAVLLRRLLGTWR